MSSEQVFDLSGGALCLDFANTLGDRPHCTQEHLRSYGDLVEWGRQAGVVREEKAVRLEKRGRRCQREGAAVLERALALREGLYRVFSRLAAGERPTERDLRMLNHWLADALPHLAVAEQDERFAWCWSDSGSSLDGMLWPVVRSAADLLTSNEVINVRECASGRCSWLFVDRSRTHRRRWCDMKTCGNRDKARRYYRRKKQAAEKSSTQGRSTR